MQNPYKLPDGNVQIAFSAGRTSAKMVYEILQANEPFPFNRVKFIFTNTGKEREETLQFAQECSEQWNFPLIWLEYRCRYTGAPHDPENKIFDTKAHSFEEVDFKTADRTGRHFEDLIRYFGYLPNRVADYCSHNLKTRTARRYCVSSGWKNWTTAIGMRADEPNRIIKKQPKERYKPWYPLYNDQVTKEEIDLFWKHQNFGLNLPIVNGTTPCGNCDGCFKKSERKRADLIKDNPERIEWWARLERQYQSTFDKTTSWDDLSKYIEKQGSWIFKENDALCQKDGGECSPY